MSTATGHQQCIGARNGSDGRRRLVELITHPASPAAESEPVRCLLELNSDCGIAVTLIDGCTAADVHDLCRLLALAGPHLDHLDVHQRASGTGPPAVADERDILADLLRVCGQVPLFAAEFTTGGLSVDAEEAFAHRLVDVATGILLHAAGRRRAP